MSKSTVIAKLKSKSPEECLNKCKVSMSSYLYKFLYLSFPQETDGCAAINFYIKAYKDPYPYPYKPAKGISNIDRSNCLMNMASCSNTKIGLSNSIAFSHNLR